MLTVFFFVLAAAPRPLTSAELEAARTEGVVFAAHAFVLDAARPRGRFFVVRDGVDGGLSVVVGAPPKVVRDHVPEAVQVRGVTFPSEGQKRHALVVLEDAQHRPLLRFYSEQLEGSERRHVRSADVERELEAMVSSDVTAELARAAWRLHHKLANATPVPLLGVSDDGRLLTGAMSFDREGLPRMRMQLSSPRGQPTRVEATCVFAGERFGGPECRCEDPLRVANEQLRLGLQGPPNLEPVGQGLPIATQWGTLTLHPPATHGAVVRLSKGLLIVTGSGSSVGGPREEVLTQQCSKSLLDVTPAYCPPGCQQVREQMRRELSEWTLPETPSVSVVFVEGL